MYRAVTLYCLRHEIRLEDVQSVKDAIGKIEINFIYNEDTEKHETFLNGENVEQEIRDIGVSEMVSQVSAIQPVREKLVSIQRTLGNQKGVVMDGRDIGTVVFPEAELKIFMTADLQVRAERRRIELLEKGLKVALAEVLENLEKRDQIDTTRKISPLTMATDAIEIDTSNLTFEEQVNEIVSHARKITHPHDN